MRVAAVGDVHLSEESAGTLRPALAGLAEQADVLLLAGDLTRHGTLAEAAVVAGEVADLGLPVVAVLGNHDYHADRSTEIAELLESTGTRVLEGDADVVEVGVPVRNVAVPVIGRAYAVYSLSAEGSRGGFGGRDDSGGGGLAARGSVEEPSAVWAGRR